jgi:hypothetical protein
MYRQKKLTTKEYGKLKRMKGPGREMMPSPELLRLMPCSATRSDAQWKISPYFHERLVASLEMDNGC